MFIELHDLDTSDDEALDRDGESLWDEHAARVAPELAATLASDMTGTLAMRARKEYGRRFRTIRSLLRQYDMPVDEKTAQDWLTAFDGVLAQGPTESAHEVLGEIHDWMAAGWTDAFRARHAQQQCGSPETALSLLENSALTVEHACTAAEFSTGGDGWKDLQTQSAARAIPY